MTEELLPALVIVGIGVIVVICLFVREAVRERRQKKAVFLSIVEIQQQQIADLWKELREHDHLAKQ